MSHFKFLVEKDSYGKDSLDLEYTRPMPYAMSFAVTEAKWKFLYRLCRQGKLVKDGGPHTCGFCKVFFWSDDHCHKCPIYHETGQTECWGTPYVAYHNALVRNDLEEATQAAKEMWQFARSLHREYRRNLHRGCVASRIKQVKWAVMRLLRIPGI